MKADIARCVTQCRVCFATKPEQKPPQGFLGKHPVSTKPWQMISIDLVGPLPKSSKGHCYVLSVSDTFSKFVLFFPLRRVVAPTIVQLLEDHVFLLFGCPQRIICDNGPQFHSKEFEKLCQGYNIEIIFTPNYSPQANPVERVHRVLKTMLAAYVSNNQRHWEAMLQKIACAIRTAKHEATNLSPYFVNFGREHIISADQYNTQLTDEQQDPVDPATKARELEQVFDDVIRRLKLAHDRSKNRYNLRRRPVIIDEGSKVYRRNHALSQRADYFSSKLAQKFIGPFIVMRRVSPTTYELADESGKSHGLWHIKDIKSHPPE